jgi:hypothetical protein
MKDNSKIEITNTLFWQMYNALRDAEGVLWSCDGATNPEDDQLTEDIVEASQTIESVLNKLQKIVCKLKEEEAEEV